MSERTRTDALRPEGVDAGLPRAGRSRVWPALLVDVAAVLVFAAVGRASHAEAHPLIGVLTTAWPFVTGLLAGWLAAFGLRRAAPVTVRDGIPVWAATVAVGMLLRVAAGRGAPLSFVVVASVVLAAFLLGWRALRPVGSRLARRRR